MLGESERQSTAMRFLFGDYSLDEGRRELCRAGTAVHVEPQVFDLLQYLVRNRDRVVTKEELLSSVWHGRIVSESTLSTRINAARRAIGDTGESQSLIKTVARRGLRFVGAVRCQVSPPGETDTDAPPRPQDLRSVLQAPWAWRGDLAPAPATCVLLASLLPTSDAADRDEAMLARRFDVIANFIGAHGGRVVSRTHGSLVAGFDDAAQAVRAAVEFQQEMVARNTSLADGAQLHFRVGISAEALVADGIRTEGEGVRPEGEGLRIAGSLAGAADPDGVCVSEPICLQAGALPNLHSIDRGQVAVPSLATPVHAYAVERLAPTAAGRFREAHGKPTVAVLPFSNMSGEPEQEHFADGITEEIITALARHRSLLVVARNSTFAFKGCGVDVRRIGTELGADYIVEGSVRKAERKMRIAAQLVETKEGRHVWAERYDRDLDDVFALQDEIAATLAARIEPEVGTAERLRVARKPPQSWDAWDFFHLGTRHLYKASSADNLEAQRLLRRAIELDREFAQAHAFLAYAIVLSMVYFDAPIDAARLEDARALARRAAELDDQDAVVRFVNGRTLLASRAYADALAELSTALELNPNLAIVHCGLGDSLAYEGRFGEAIPYFDKAISLSPYDPQRWAFYAYRALAHLLAQEFEQAFSWAQKATRIPNSHYWPYAHRVAALGYLQRRSEGTRIAVDELLQKKPGFCCSFARSRLFYLKDAAQLDLYTEGLRRAGIAE